MPLKSCMGELMNNLPSSSVKRKNKTFISQNFNEQFSNDKDVTETVL